MGGSCALAFATGSLSDQFANLAFAYEDYGFSYCFLQTWLNRASTGPRATAGPRWTRSWTAWRKRHHL